MSKMLKYIDGSLIEYEIFKLVDFYDPILRKPTEPFVFVKDDHKNIQEAKFLAYSMSETLQKLEGLGLSANQLGINKRLCVINMGDKIWIMFNPTITWKSAELSSFSEGCLSYPGLYLKIPRSNKITVRFQAMYGDWVEQTVEGLTAVCIQHELDHLDGIMYTDHVSPITLEKAKRKVKKTLKKMTRITTDDLKKLGVV